MTIQRRLRLTCKVGISVLPKITDPKLCVQVRQALSPVMGLLCVTLQGALDR